MAIRSFAIIVENEVAFVLQVDDSLDLDVVRRLIPALLSNPKFIECSNEVTFNWSWDGSIFNPPATGA